MKEENNKFSIMDLVRRSKQHFDNDAKNTNITKVNFDSKYVEEKHGLNGYRRRLSPVERLWLTADQRAVIVISMVIEGYFAEGIYDFNLDQWQNASDIASAANPGSRVRLQGSLRGTWWVDSGESVPVKIVNAPDWDGCSNKGAAFLEEKLNIYSGPIGEVLLVKGGSVPRVVFRTHHAAGDGGGGITFIQDLFRVLRGEEPLGSSSTITDLDIAQHQGKSKFGGFPKPGIAPTGFVKPEITGTEWIRRSVPAKLDKYVPTMCKALADAARKHQNGEVYINVTVDMRQRVAGLRSTANLTGVMTLQVKPSTSIKDLQKEVIKQLRSFSEGTYIQDLSIIRHLPLWLLRKGIEKDVKRAQAEHQYVPSAGMTYIDVPLTLTSGGGFISTTHYAIPPLTDFMSCTLFALVTDNSTEVVLAVPNCLGSEGRMEALMDMITDVIQSNGISSEDCKIYA